ncbi:hypothetical protein BOO25_00790 [Vibrio navarrensis]|uniref:hypothetical protein n=1 Tax=Vibrio navarrensis TaxID=29495 RepID=UPI00192F11DF|nr:hypothetical protein [Vibrio navarrensis]MBE3667481.1 hypothetical protein [Vibrio navarrensis]
MPLNQSKLAHDLPIHSHFAIHYHHWTLRVKVECSVMFELIYREQVQYQGKLELMNNGEPLDISQVQWKFRHRPDRIEQWCQLHHADKLSLNMNYFFHEQALVIEYLARNSIPTRLDIRHAIVPLEALNTGGDSSPVCTNWQRCRHGLPSASIRHSIKPDLFREAFSATQWIVLDKM